MSSDFHSHQTQGKSQINVAIVCFDLGVAKKLSQVFKQVGVHPYVCTSLSDFWEDSVKQTPDLTIIDVKMMSQGDILFKDHPLIISRELSVAFYYEQDTAALLYSTFDILNLGLINGDLSPIGQIKSVLNRYNSYQSWQNKARRANEAEAAVDSKLSQIVSKTEELKEKTFYQALQKSIQGRLEAQKQDDDFFIAVSRVLSGVKEVKKFSFLELSPSGQKLISPKFLFDKYVEIPSLWLGKTCEKGVEFFAQNMASQVCLELMGGDLMSLLIKGSKEEADVLLFVQVEGEEFLAQFDWESLERYLCGLYCHFQLRGTSHSKEGLSLSRTFGHSWELFSQLDEINFGKIPESRIEGGLDRYTLIGVDFSTLVSRALGQRELRFYWNRFIMDFVRGLETQKKLNFKSFLHSPSKILMLVEAEQSENVLAQTKAYGQRYPYWRYFEDADVVLGASLKPELQFVPMSPQAIETWATQALSADETETQAQAVQTKGKRKVITDGFFHPGSEQNM